jgi:hypothetical protein
MADFDLTQPAIHTLAVFGSSLTVVALLRSLSEAVGIVVVLDLVSLFLLVVGRQLLSLPLFFSHTHTPSLSLSLTLSVCYNLFLFSAFVKISPFFSVSCESFV